MAAKKYSGMTICGIVIPAEAGIQFVMRKHMGTYYVYIVECKDGTFYTGYTPDLEKRLKAHNEGKGAKYTRGRGPVKVVWSEGYRYRKTARKEEYRIKQLSREQKEKLVLL